MPSNMNRLVVLGIVAALAAMGAAGIGGCAKPAAKPEAATAAVAPAAEVAAVPAKSGVQIWAETCNRCHNLRDPAWRTADQREVALHHMRLRVPLTGEDQRAILEFLRAE
jgi:cytochrome c5